MSCVVGVMDSKDVTIGGDSASINGKTKMLNTFPKVFKVGELKIGFVGSWRVGQVLSYGLTLPDSSPFSGAEQEYVVRVLIPRLKILLGNNGLLLKNKNGLEYFDGTIMVGFLGKLFTVWSEFQAEESQSGYDAIGCARDIALGSLYTTEGMKMTPEFRVKLALEAACSLSTDVAAPLVFV